MLGIVGFFLGAILLLLITIAVRKKKKVYDKVNKIKESIFWNAIIRAFQTAYLGLMFSAFSKFALYYDDQENVSIFTLVQPLVMIVGGAAFCAWLVRFLLKHQAAYWKDKKT